MRELFTKGLELKEYICMWRNTVFEFSALISGVFRRRKWKCGSLGVWEDNMNVYMIMSMKIQGLLDYRS